MHTKKILLTISALALGLAAFTAIQAQGPLYDKVIVDLPYTITVGEHILQPGEYVIRQLPSSGGASRVMLIYSDKGMKFETSAMTIPALDNRTPEDTKVVLHHFGNDYYFDKIWIQGKNYGYEFPLPDSVKARQRERMEPMTVAARYEATQETQTAQTTETTPAPAPAPEVAQAPPPPAQEAAPAPQEPTPAPAAPEAAPAPAPAPEAHREMPVTAANWMLMLVSGGMLSGAGLLLRRK